MPNDCQIRSIENTFTWSFSICGESYLCLRKHQDMQNTQVALQT